MNNLELKRSWRQVPKLLKVLLLIALTGAIAILILRLWPERIGLGEEIGNMLSTMCLAYVGGFTTSFLWNHFRRVTDLERASRLRASAIRYMAAAHNCFFDPIITGDGSARPFDCEDYSRIPRKVLHQRTRERWDEQKLGLEQAGLGDLWQTYLDDSLEMFKEHFEDIDPLMSQFHPTFVMALNRIRRTLPKRIIVGSQDGPATGHDLSGPLSQMGTIQSHINWLREVHVQIDKESDHDIDGAIPRLTKEELIARGIPKAMLDKMERGE